MIKSLDRKEITFISEQEGEIEREFKNELSKSFFGMERDIRGYLALIQYKNTFELSVALCLKINGGDESLILKKCESIFKSIFSSNEHLDILIISDIQELELRKLCCPFYTSVNFQIKYPDFYLYSSEGYELNNIRNCYKRKRLFGKNPDGYILCDVEPVILGQQYGLGDKDINKIVIVSRHKGYSLFPIRQWPFYVHVARPLVNLESINSLEGSEIDLIAWAELYKNKEDI